MHESSRGPLNQVNQVLKFHWIVDVNLCRIHANLKCVYYYFHWIYMHTQSPWVKLLFDHQKIRMKLMVLTKQDDAAPTKTKNK